MPDLDMVSLLADHVAREDLRKPGDAERNHTRSLQRRARKAHVLECDCAGRTGRAPPQPQSSRRRPVINRVDSEAGSRYWDLAALLAQLGVLPG